MSPLSMLTAAAEHRAGPNVDPVIIGVGAFVLLLILMGALLAFGGGRDHS